MSATARSWSLVKRTGGQPISIPIPVRDAAEEHTLLQVLAELREQTSIQKQIAAAVEQLTEVTHFTFTVRTLGAPTATGDDMNLDINDDGKGFSVEGVPDKAIKPGETYAWSASDPTAVNLAADPSKPDTPTFVRVVGTLPTPAKDVTGLVITLTVQRLAGGPLVENVDPQINIVPDPNGEVGSFLFTEAAA